MSSEQKFVDYIVDQIQNAGKISFRKMFGEYALYCNGKVFALVCDNQLFVKETAGGKAFIGDFVEAPAYTGAKMSFLIEDKLDDREWLSELVRITAKELPEKKVKSEVRGRKAAKDVDSGR